MSTSKKIERDFGKRLNKYQPKIAYWVGSIGDADGNVYPYANNTTIVNVRDLNGGLHRVLNQHNRATPWPRSLPSSHAYASRSVVPMLSVKTRCLETAQSSEMSPSGSAAMSGGGKLSGRTRMKDTAVSRAVSAIGFAPSPSQLGH